MAGCAAMNGRSTWSSTYKPVVLADHARDPRRHGLALHHRSQGLLPDRGYRLPGRSAPRLRPTSRFEAMVERQAQDRRHHPAGPAVDYVNSTVGAGGPNSDRQQRPHVRRAEAAKTERDSRSPAVIQRLRAPRPMPCRASRPFFIPIQNINIGGRISKAEYQYTLQIERHRGALPGRAGAARQASPSCRSCATSSTDLYIRNPQMIIEIDREKAAVYGITVDQIRQDRSTAPSARVRSRPSTRRPTTIRSSSRAAGIPAAILPTLSQALRCKHRASGQPVPLRRRDLRQLIADRRAVAWSITRASSRR